MLSSKISNMVYYKDDAIIPIPDHFTAKQYLVIMNLFKSLIFYDEKIFGMHYKVVYIY